MRPQHFGNRSPPENAPAHATAHPQQTRSQIAYAKIRRGPLFRLELTMSKERFLSYLEAVMTRQYMAVAVTLAALGASVSAARSNEYPTLNVAPVCHGIVEQSDLEAGLRATNFDQCIKAEQDNREQIIKEWSQFSADDRRHCIAESTMGGESSYTELLTCLEMARDVRQLHSQGNSSSAPTQQVPPAPVGHRQPTQ